MDASAAASLGADDDGDGDDAAPDELGDPDHSSDRFPLRNGNENEDGNQKIPRDARNARVSWFRRVLRERFLDGDDPNFEYAALDAAFTGETAGDAEEAYFAETRREN